MSVIEESYTKTRSVHYCRRRDLNILHTLSPLSSYQGHFPKHVFSAVPAVTMLAFRYYICGIHSNYFRFLQKLIFKINKFLYLTFEFSAYIYEYQFTYFFQIIHASVLSVALAVE